MVRVGQASLPAGNHRSIRDGEAIFRTLLRESVDLESGFITVKTSKAGETVQIPIFPLLRKVLEDALAKPSPRAPHYVFPHLE